uniref:(California timema) hypothetical protein n=1 Tax=Timema californicum TaxID=61474 RepID=A0A7R9JE17_TIMCA|nr:unnamed protein product [Timema californicum]
MRRNTVDCAEKESFQTLHLARRQFVTALNHLIGFIQFLTQRRPTGPVVYSALGLSDSRDRPQVNNSGSRPPLINGTAKLLDVLICMFGPIKKINVGSTRVNTTCEVCELAALDEATKCLGDKHASDTASPQYPIT